MFSLQQRAENSQQNMKTSNTYWNQTLTE